MADLWSLRLTVPAPKRPPTRAELMGVSDRNRRAAPRPIEVRRQIERIRIALDDIDRSYPEMFKLTLEQTGTGTKDRGAEGRRSVIPANDGTGDTLARYEGARNKLAEAGAAVARALLELQRAQSSLGRALNRADSRGDLSSRYCYHCGADIVDDADARGGLCGSDRKYKARNGELPPLRVIENRKRRA